MTSHDSPVATDNQTKPFLGMYVHMHWGYNHPYAARTWSLADWTGYANGLKALGYNLIMIWPMTETMPYPPTPSDLAHLTKIQGVIEMLHGIGMQAIICVAPNTVANAQAAHYPFESRPFFKCDARLDPANSQEMDRMMEIRHGLLSYLRNADGIAVIDSDPGGYIGSTNAEFTALLWRYVELVKELNPQAKLYYWQWVGWESYNRFWAASQKSSAPVQIEFSKNDCLEVVKALLAKPQEPWALFRGIHLHQEVINETGTAARSVFFQYSVVEGEPTYPLTNYNPKHVEDALRNYRLETTGLGAMTNAQSHALQQPNTYAYAHFAQGKAAGNLDFAWLANQMIPGSGRLLARAWDAIGARDTTRMRRLAGDVTAAAKEDYPAGPLGGLLFGSAARYLDDLALQLNFRAALLDFRTAVETHSDVHAARLTLAQDWTLWKQRTGFVDGFCGPVYDEFSQAAKALHEPEMDKVLADFDNWQDPSIRHGIVNRLINALTAAA
jgi:hypothetical protein